MQLNSLTTSHWQIRGKEMPATFEMLLQYFSRHLRAGHLVVAVNKFNFFLIHHFHVGRNAPCLPPPPPHKFCLTIVFDFSWDDCNTQKKLETMVMEKLGAGATRYIVVYVKMVNGLLRTFSFLKGVYKWILNLHCCTQFTFLNEKLCQ